MALAIGAPGTAGGLGAVYVIPDTFSIPGASTSISIAQAQTLTATNSAGGNPAALGTSVSTRPLFAANQFYTVDQDPLDDLIIGAPGYNPTVIGNAAGTVTTRPLAGTAFAVSGLKLLDRINPAIGINSLTPNFAFNPSTTTTITIFVASTPATPTQPAFAPFTQLDPTSNTRLQQELTLLLQGEIDPDEFISTMDGVIAENGPKAFK
jgi:hypothetical protein